MSRFTQAAVLSVVALSLVLACASPLEAGWLRRSRQTCSPPPPCVPVEAACPYGYALLYCAQDGYWRSPGTDPALIAISRCHPSSWLDQPCNVWQRSPGGA